MKIAIAGGSGFVGKHLTQYYLERKISLILISRKKQSSNHPLIRYATWSELETDVKVMEGTDVIVNLAGESINQRWTQAVKEKIVQSRLDTTKAIASIVKRMENKPSVVINASGIAIYGTSETESFVEHSDTSHDDFLSGVVQQWEEAMDTIEETRVVKLRLGIVLARDGGVLPRMMKPYKLGVGGRVGNGRQFVSWIHIKDLCNLVDFCISNEDIIGQINATAPQPVTMDELGKQMASALHTRHWFPVPGVLMKLMFGEMSLLVLEGQRVLPLLAIEYDFHFLFPTIEMALTEVINQSTSR